MDERDIARFWSKVERKAPEECWLWKASLQKRGYGNFHFLHPVPRSWLAHRAGWAIVNGPIPDGMFVCHRCDNPPCVNPAHLFLGTNDDNMKDMAVKTRSRTCGNRSRGEAHSATRYSDEVMAEVHALRARGVPVKEVAAMFGISTVTVWNYANGRRSHSLNPKWPTQDLPPRNILSRPRS